MFRNTRRRPLSRLELRARTRTLGVVTSICGVVLGGPVSLAAGAEAPVPLGTASSFVLLAGSTATNTGPSTLNGDLGLFPGTAVTGFGSPATVNGAQHVNDSVAMQAQADLGTAYDVAAGRAPSGALPPELAGLRLTPGVYRAPASVGISGRLTLDAEGDPSAVFIFQVGSALTTASASSIVLVNGAQPCNVFWQVGSSATLGSGSTFVGTILARASITVDDAVTVEGRTLARNGAVTLINDTLTTPRCSSEPSGTGDQTPTPTAFGSEPGGTTPSGPPTETTTSPDAGTDGDRGTATASPTTARARRTRLPGGRVRITVDGGPIARVVFTRAGRRIAVRRGGPAVVTVRVGPDVVRARVTYTDGRRATTLRVRVPRRPATPSRPPRGPGGFVG